MEKEKSPLVELLSWAAVAGNILFILWITYNGINEHFRGTVFEKLSYIGLVVLLTVNTVLVLRGRRQKE